MTAQAFQNTLKKKKKSSCDKLTQKIFETDWYDYVRLLPLSYNAAELEIAELCQTLIHNSNQIQTSFTTENMKQFLLKQIPWIIK